MIISLSRKILKLWLKQSYARAYLVMSNVPSSHFINLQNDETQNFVYGEFYTARHARVPFFMTTMWQAVTSWPRLRGPAAAQLTPARASCRGQHWSHLCPSWNIKGGEWHWGSWLVLSMGETTLLVEMSDSLVVVLPEISLFLVLPAARLAVRAVPGPPVSPRSLEMASKIPQS